MTVWGRIKAANRRFDEHIRGAVAPGKIFDMRSYKGNIRMFLFWAAATYFLWHLHDLFAWERRIFNIPYEIDRAKQRWAQLWAWIIGGGGMALSILAMVMIPIRRHLARKSAQGQWYDKPELSKREFGPDDEPKTPDAK